MKKKILYFALLLMPALAVLNSCKCEKDEPPTPDFDSKIELVIELYNGATPMLWNATVALDNVNEYRMEFFKYYLSNIKAVNASGVEIALKDVVIADASKSDGMTFTFDAPSGAYDKLLLGVGLDAVLNAKDPVTFEPSEPLSAAQAMYWSWATKYRFVKIDARANQLGAIGDTNDILIAYHPGADDFYEVVALNKPFNLSASAPFQYKIKLDLATFFNGPGGVINIPTESQTHTTPTDYDLAVKFMKNFAASFEAM